MRWKGEFLIPNVKVGEQMVPKGHHPLPPKNNPLALAVADLRTSWFRHLSVSNLCFYPHLIAHAFWKLISVPFWTSIAGKMIQDESWLIMV